MATFNAHKSHWLLTYSFITLHQTGDMSPISYYLLSLLHYTSPLGEIQHDFLIYPLSVTCYPGKWCGWFMTQKMCQGIGKQRRELPGKQFFWSLTQRTTSVMVGDTAAGKAAAFSNFPCHCPRTVSVIRDMTLGLVLVAGAICVLILADSCTEFCPTNLERHGNQKSFYCQCMTYSGR